MPAESLTTPSAAPPLRFEDAVTLVHRLDEEVGRVIIGQRQVRHDILTCLLAGGHCLLRGVPGLAKTLLIKTLADAVHLTFSRIQFTPDLMPSDILGTEVIEDDAAGGKRHVRFLPGPVFANIILADEINRTPPRTQAALLEAMQERKVTSAGTGSPSAACAPHCSGRSSCSPPRTRSNRKGPIRCPKRSWTASSSTS